jgi:hypothetical protein
MAEGRRMLRLTYGQLEHLLGLPREASIRAFEGSVRRDEVSFIIEGIGGEWSPGCDPVIIDPKQVTRLAEEDLS